jgi:hypothetical protein
MDGFIYMAKLFVAVLILDIFLENAILFWERLQEMKLLKHFHWPWFIRKNSRRRPKGMSLNLHTKGHSVAA